MAVYQFRPLQHIPQVSETEWQSTLSGQIRPKRLNQPAKRQESRNHKSGRQSLNNKPLRRKLGTKLSERRIILKCFTIIHSTMLCSQSAIQRIHSVTQSQSNLVQLVLGECTAHSTCYGRSVIEYEVSLSDSKFQTLSHFLFVIRVRTYSLYFKINLRN